MKSRLKFSQKRGALKKVRNNSMFVQDLALEKKASDDNDDKQSEFKSTELVTLIFQQSNQILKFEIPL